MSTFNVLAFDPGPTWMGWCELRVEHGPGLRTTFVQGGHLPCTFHTFVSVLNNASGAAAGPNAPPYHVAVERPRGFAFQPGRVPQLLDTAFPAGGMSWVAQYRGLRVVEASAQQVRKVLAGKANADDGVVRDTVERNVFGASGATNDHVRDAVAVGLLGAWVLVGQAVLPDLVTKKQGGKRGKSLRTKVRATG